MADETDDNLKHWIAAKKAANEDLRLPPGNRHELQRDESRRGHQAQR
jgi:plasmid maintenance system killer protein